MYGSSSIKKAPYRTKPLWCAHNRRRPHGHNARCRDQPGAEPARRTSGSQKAASRSPPERGPYRLFQADTRSSASCCSRLSPQYSPTITWSHSALPLHATTVRSGFNRLRVGEKDCRPRRHASPALPAMAVPAAARPPHRASAPAGGASGRAGGCACLLLGLSDLRGLFSVPRPCTPSFQLALLSFLWEESVERECRHFCNSLLSRVRGETSLATAKTSKIEELRHYLIQHHQKRLEAATWLHASLQCRITTCLLYGQSQHERGLAQLPPRSQCKTPDNFTGCRIKHNDYGLRMLLCSCRCVRTVILSSQKICVCKAMRHIAASFMLFQELSYATPQSHVPQSTYSCDPTAKVFFFFDGSAEVLSYVLNYCRTKHFHCPVNTCRTVLEEEELAFWGTQEAQLASCCWLKLNNKAWPGEFWGRNEQTDNRCLTVQAWEDVSTGELSGT